MGSLAKALQTDFKRWGSIKVRCESNFLRSFTKQLRGGLLVAVTLEILFKTLTRL